MRQKKYIEFLSDVAFPKERVNYIKNVKYRIVEETSDKYVTSKRKGLAFSKSKEGEAFIVGLY